MIDRSRLYMPNFSSPKGECINCGSEMSDHDYISGQFICLANTKESMAEIMATVKACEKAWQFDLDHGLFTVAEKPWVIAMRTDSKNND